jgi:hypothetical protein
MTKGCVVYAYDGAYPYLRIAARAAELVKQQLDLPVTLITDCEYDKPVFDQVIVEPRTDTEQLREFNGELLPWHNQNRSTVYQLSPYDQTLLIDADYFMFNNTLGSIFDTDTDFACFGSTYELGVTQTLEKRIGATSIPMQWATVIYFTKSELAKSVFDFMSYIKHHYEFYSLLYGFRNHQFRNDYALSIALQTLTGYNVGNYSALPGMLVTATDNIHVSAIKNNSVFYSYRTGRGLLGSKSVGNNTHFLNKDQLLAAMDVWEYEKS